MESKKRIYLSPPFQNGTERESLNEVLHNNWLSTVGPQLKQFESSIKNFIDKDVLAVSSGTSALHLILNHLEIGKGDEVFVSDLTFVASVNPLKYQAAQPLLIDSEKLTWNLDPDILEDTLRKKLKSGQKIPKALILVQLYGMPAQMERITSLCKEFNVVLIEDSAEALGSTYDNKAVGTFGDFGFLSFNGNKIITTSGGGAVIGNGKDLKHILKLATQAKEEELYYEHLELGFNYRLSNVSAALGLAQMNDIEFRVKRKREIFEVYKAGLSDYLDFLEEPEGYFSSRWLSCGLFKAQVGIKELIKELDQTYNIECRPIWKPMHLQPLYSDTQFYGSGVSEELFRNGICLPSGIGLTSEDQEFVIESFKKVIER